MKKIICESSEDIIAFANKVLHLRRHAITNGSKKTVEIIKRILIRNSRTSLTLQYQMDLLG